MSFPRFLSGIAEAGSWNAGMTILRATYPNIKNTMMAWTEMAFGIGACFGPPLGSLLYEIGGFSLPFWMVGSLALVQTLTLFYAIPHWNFTQISTVSKMPLTLKDVLSFWILVPYWDLFVTYLGYGLINSMLEEYMYKETGANEFQIGGTFTGLGLVYMVFSLSSGYVRPQFIFFFRFDSLIHRIFVIFCFHRFPTLSSVPRKR